MKWEDWLLLGTLSIIVAGSSLTGWAFFSHTHYNHSHLGLTATRADCDANDNGSDPIHLSELSPPVRNAVEEVLDNRGEEVVFHAGELIDGDQGGDWAADSDEEAAAADTLFDLGWNNTLIQDEDSCYRLDANAEAGVGPPIHKWLLGVIGILLIVYGAYKAVKTIKYR